MEDASKIRIFRALHGLGQVEFGHYLQGDRPAVCKWEAGVYKPNPEAMQKVGIYNWMSTGGRLPSQLFAPLLPNVPVRSQSVNHFLGTITELLPEFCKSENISQNKVEVYLLEDGDVIRLGEHIIFAFGAMKSISDLLPAELKPTEKRLTGLLLSDFIKTREETSTLLRIINCNSNFIDNINCFRLQDTVWNSNISIGFQLTIKHLNPNLKNEVEDLIKASLKKALSESYKKNNPEVTIQFQKVI